VTDQEIALLRRRYEQDMGHGSTLEQLVAARGREKVKHEMIWFVTAQSRPLE